MNSLELIREENPEIAEIMDQYSEIEKIYADVVSLTVIPDESELKSNFSTTTVHFVSDATSAE